MSRENWFCDKCKTFVPDNEVYLDEDTYVHIKPEQSECKGTCHTK